MAKKRKSTRQPAVPEGPKGYDPSDARIGPVTSYKDIADEQEQHFIDEDEILFEDEQPDSKRRKRQEEEEEFLDQSDDEVFARDSEDSADDSSDDSDDDDEYQRLKKTQRALAVHNKNYQKAVADKYNTNLSDDDEEDDADDGGEGGSKAEGDEGWWGTSKKEYYDNEAIETEENALEEEAEARKLQSKQLSRMTASDFFDEDEWAVDGDEDKEAVPGSGDVVKVALKTAEEVDRMTPEEQYKYLQAMYPEFDYMCDEFLELEPLLIQYKKEAEGKSPHTIEVVIYRSLACYLATVTLYFSLLMSPTRDNPGGSKYLMDPEELHSHEVMDYLLDCRKTWEHAKRVKARRERRAAEAKADADADAVADIPVPKSSKKGSELAVHQGDFDDEDLEDTEAEKAFKKEKKDKKKKASDADTIDKTTVAALAKVMEKNRKKKEARKLEEGHPKATATAVDTDNSRDLGEEYELDERTGLEKAQRKKTLAFYTAQVAQRDAKRSRNAHSGDGDMDVPYRERLRDRQARLNAEAERRGLRAPKPGEELGGDGGEDGEEEPEGKTKEEQDEYDESLAFYDSIVKKHKDKQAVKAERRAAVEAGRLDRVQTELWQDKDGRRQLTRQIEKNKGLNHKTVKERKNNPRVKKRVKFQKKTQQLASMRHMYKAGVDPSKYQGERTGISTGLVRSVKLD